MMKPELYLIIQRRHECALIFFPRSAYVHKKHRSTIFGNKAEVKMENKQSDEGAEGLEDLTLENGVRGKIV